ncbi:MAG: LON peptidase substrate-binding domain-containing protein [Arenicella sp.]
MKQTVALFPLPSIVLPGGKLSLRIFEPRYIRMVTEAFRQQRQFGLCIPEVDELSRYLGTLIDIVDFSQLEDGLLGIVVQGKQRFITSEVNVEDDGLKVAEIEWLPDWPDRPGEVDDLLISSWRSFCSQYQEYRTLYDGIQNNNLSWHCQRWLEVLPIDVTVKKRLLLEKDCNEAYLFLSSMLSQ